MKDLLALKRQFLEHLEIERGRSIKTVENYDRYLERFFAFTEVKSVVQLNEKHVRDFRLYLGRQSGTMVDGQAESMKHSTQNYYLTALRVFLKFLRMRGIEALSPELIELTKVPERSLDLISLTELKSLLAAPDPKTLEGKRDKAIMELFFSTGLRISELCALSLGDINLDQNEFMVSGKNGKMRTVYLSETAKVILCVYLKNRKDMDDSLFVRHGRKRNDGGPARLQPRAVQRLFKHHATIAGITRKVTPHVLRHSFATDLLSSGADLHSVQALLGHTHISATQVYTQATDKHLREVHKNFHRK